MYTSDYLTNHVLIAMPTLADPNYFQSAVLICQHTEEGAMGIIINRPTDISLSEILTHLGVSSEEDKPKTPDEEIIDDSSVMDKTPIYVGGPLQRERGFVLHEPNGKWESSVVISDEIAITSSKDILEAIASGKGPEKQFVALGYCAWAPGQLEDEIAQNLWLSGPMRTNLVFDVSDDDRWQAAATSIGVDLNLISGKPGHA